MSQGPPEPAFDDAFRARLHDLFVWRRDVRRFTAEPLADGVLQRLLDAAHLAPSVGLSQPWRFVLVESPERRAAVADCFRICNREALEAYAPDHAADYARLKLEGLREAPCHLAVFADPSTAQGRGLGRRTMPEMIEYSVVAAICNLWLAARAEGMGVGWVSILDPARVAEILDTPPHWRLIGYLCIGHPASHDHSPELERAGWERRRPVANHVFRR